MSIFFLVFIISDLSEVYELFRGDGHFYRDPFCKKIFCDCGSETQVSRLEQHRKIQC